MSTNPERETAPAGRAGASQKLQLVIAVQILVPGVLLAWRLATGHLPFGGWAWGMYS